MKIARLVTFVCFLAAVPVAFSQNSAPALRLVPAPAAASGYANDFGVVEGAPVASPFASPVQAAKAGAATAATPANPERTKKRKAILDKLTFDRRPSSILKAWSTPMKSKEQEEKEAEEKKKKEAEENGEEETKPTEKQKPDKPAEEPAKKPLTDEEKKAKAAADKAAAAAKEAADKKKAEAEKLAAEISQLAYDVRVLQRNVTLANWAEVSAFIDTLDKAEANSLYAKLLQSLVVGPKGQPKTRSGMIIGERNVIRATDVMALGELCPGKKLEDSHTAMLGQLANLCQAEGQAEYIFLETLKDHVAQEKEGQKINRRAAARLLFAANRIEQARSFLPTVEDAATKDDVEALSILTDVFLRLYQKENEKPLLEESWHAAQALLIAEKSDDDQRQKAMKRCVMLVPMLRDELGQKWLNDSFTSEPEKGMKILAGIGGASAQSMKDQPRNPDERVATLQLQQTAVEALLKDAPKNAESWSTTLHLLASNWLREATYSRKYDSTTQRGPSMTRDMYGNYFWSGTSSTSRPPSGMPQPIQSGKVLDVQPGKKWLSFLEPGYRSQFSIETARLHLRVKEETDAFPYIEQLAETHKDEATDLVREFLDVWADNHDPNSQNRRTSVYMFSYGYSQRSRGIPLTRSRQVRNLQELAGWVKRIRKLPLEDIDDRWISSAFTRIHSSAEVYQLSDMERVFGDTENMEAETLAALLQTMRTNLASIWRKPDVQKQSKTNRKQKEIEAEVVQGYEAAQLLLNQALDDHPENWELQLVRAALRHDENDYRAQLNNSADFATSRKSALKAFATAVDSYAKTVSDLKESEYTVEPYQFWFNAALGAPDINQITQDKLPVLSQMPLIRDSFSNLPPESREKHLEMFANSLFTRMSSVNPAVKLRYVREGLGIVGAEREQSREAQKVFEYYNDLVTEIKMETVLDGSPAVGHEQPFGVYVNLRHTKAIERESGGFAKYLQNQNSGSRYYYNYGRPTENYREKFENYAREALDEHFEVLSLTFQPETVASRATEEPGWRTTSYAYVLLKARGPEIDRVAPLKLDLDFMDTTGYVVLPVESQALMVDCTTTDTDPRPINQLSVTQTLDERQAKDKKLVVEIKAAAQGLVPELKDILDLKFADFEVTKIEDNGLSVARFDPESNKPVVVSDRLWTLTLEDKDSAAKEKRTFMFASAKLPLHEEAWQRYDDADLVEVEQTVTLMETYDEPKRTAEFLIIAVALLLVFGGIVAWMLIRSPQQQAVAKHRFLLPESPTPFNVLSLLKDIERNNGLSQQGKAELATSINRIERHYFAEELDVDAPDLHEVAETWVGRAARAGDGGGRRE